MRLSELIDVLKFNLSQYGDIKVTLERCDCDSNEVDYNLLTYVELKQHLDDKFLVLQDD